MTNKQVRISDEEQRLLLLIRAAGISLDDINNFVAAQLIRKTVTKHYPASPEAIQQQVNEHFQAAQPLGARMQGRE